MNNNYLLVKADILPDYFEKVVQAQELLDQNKVKGISEAVQKVGISRSTYYKYKDAVKRYSSYNAEKKAIISLLLPHKKGILSEVLNILAKNNASILTISQSLPIHNIANVLISLDITELSISIENMIDSIKKEVGINSITLVALE